MIKAILFDLDGTLLPMDLDVFIKSYFNGITKKICPSDPAHAKQLGTAVWEATLAMLHNSGELTNEEVFWNSFHTITAGSFADKLHLFDEFYLNEYESLQSLCEFQSEASEIIALVRELGFRVVLATNPVFPRIAVDSRLHWAGVEPSSFEYITTFSNSHYAKPNPAYYAEIADTLGLLPEECLMVGNDTGDDMAARQIGMRVFLLTPYLINKSGADIREYPSGGYADLIAHIKAIAENMA